MTIETSVVEEMIATAKSYIGANGYDPDPEQIISALSELLALRAGKTGWQPMESAPISDACVFEMTTALREAYELNTGETINDAWALRMALEKAMLSAGMQVEQ